MTKVIRTNYLLVAMLWFAGLGAAAQFGKISVLYDVLSETYAGYSVAIVVSVVGIVGLVFGTTSGLIVQRVGYRRVLVGALIAGAALSAFQATLPAYPLLIASRVIEGFSHLSIVVAGPVLIATVTQPKHFGAAMSLWSSFFGVSFALTAWAGLALVDIYGPSALFLAHAVFMAVMAIILFKLVPARTAQPETSAMSLSSLIRQHKEIYGSPTVAAPGLGFVFYTALYVALLTLLPQQFSGADRIFVATAMPLISIFVSLTIGVWLLTYFDAVSLVQAGFAVAGLAGVWLWFGFGLGPIPIAAALVLAAALGLVQGASFASIPALNSSQEDRAHASGALAQMGNLGTTSGTPILALFVAGFGVTGTLMFILPLAIGGIVVTRLLARRRLNS
jgi:DHA1 family inner membrane transport protein